MSIPTTTIEIKLKIYNNAKRSIPAHYSMLPIVTFTFDLQNQYRVHPLTMVNMFAKFDE